MCNENEWIVREAFRFYDQGDVARMMDFVAPDLEWTFYDPGQDPQPHVSHGRDELKKAVLRQVSLGLRAVLEEVVAAGDQVILVMRTEGLDQHREAGDRTYDVATVRHGMIVELHACRDRGEARALAGIA
jgi:ketosteroid isomerase-like protein